jgi:hypothetical protein
MIDISIYRWEKKNKIQDIDVTPQITKWSFKWQSWISTEEKPPSPQSSKALSSSRRGEEQGANNLK